MIIFDIAYIKNEKHSLTTSAFVFFEIVPLTISEWAPFEITSFSFKALVSLDPWMFFEKDFFDNGMNKKLEHNGDIFCTLRNDVEKKSYYGEYVWDFPGVRLMETNDSFLYK